MSTGTLLQSNTSSPLPQADGNGPTNGAQMRKSHDDTHRSPACHSGRLVYAKPQDLPSFPSVGLGPNGSAAGAAASLGWNKKTSPEIWKPDSSTSASTAALLAHDQKMAASWAPSPSSQGAQAALLAHKNAKNTEAWKPANSDHGHTAANQAFKANRNTAAAHNRDNGHSAANQAFKASRNAPATNNRADVRTLNRQRSLMAAKGAMTTRPRSNTAPTPKDSYPDETHAAANALKAATAAHKPNRSATGVKGGAVPYTTMNRQMYTSHPPVKPEVEEQSREDQLHATAVAMAKKMFTQQQKVIDQAKKSQAARPGPRRTRSSSSLSDDEVQPMQFNTLQDAAYKLAQERLSKLHEDNLKNREYQEYYGHVRPQRKFTMKGRLQRRRSASEGDLSQDKIRSQQIKKQMSIFSSKLSEVDDKKRQKDRDALLAAARRNVEARLKGMDDKVAADTGMVPPSRLTDWEVKAQAAAQSRSDNRLSKHGKIDIGAGKYMGQDEIDAIAAQRVQPTLDEINEKAEKEHARQTELRLEAEAKKAEREREKAREREVADIAKKLKEQEKHENREKKAEEKQEARAKREEEKAAKAEQKRLAKSERHKSAPPISLPFRHGRHEESKEQLHEERPRTTEQATEERVALNDVGQPVRIPAATVSSDEQPASAPPIDIPAARTHARSESSSPTDKVSPTGKVKTWFKSRFSRGSKSEEDRPKDSVRKGFVGGHSLTGMDSNNASTVSVDNRSASVRAVAMAGRRRTDLSEDQSATNADQVSPMSSSSDEAYFSEAREGLSSGLSPPRPVQDPAAKKSHSPVRDSRFHEII
ncbi:hypothetical protein JX266_001484 [Neoarthrinium moseri]|nr:hypothetical protein JX266_001484 [Neoarthrinium moseri]